MKKALCLIALLCLAGTAWAQTPKQKSALQSEVTGSFPDNSSGAITPSTMRTVLGDLIASWQQYSGVNKQVGTSYNFVGSDYGQAVVFSNASAKTGTLPTPASSFLTFNVFVNNTGTANLVLSATGGTINGLSSLTIAQNTSYWLISDGSGTNYSVIPLATAPPAVVNSVIAVVTPVTKTTIQDAINIAALAVTNSATAIVQIPAGSWNIDTSGGPITISTGSVIVQGVGSDIANGTGTVLVTSNAANHLFNVTTAGSVVFRDLGVSSSVTRNSGTSAIYINDGTFGDTSKKSIYRMSIYGQYDAIRIDECAEYSIVDNSFLSFTHAGVLLDAPDTTDAGAGVVEFNKFWDIAGSAGATAGLIWHKGSGVRIHNNRFLGAFLYGIYVNFDRTLSDDGAMLISGNTFEVQKKNGIFFEQSSASGTSGHTIGQIVIDGNFFQAITSGYQHVVMVSNSNSAWVNGLVISANTVQTNITQVNNASFQFDAVANANVSGNYIFNTGAGDSGFSVGGKSSNVSLINNKITGGTITNYFQNTLTSTNIVDYANRLTVAALPVTAANGSQIFTTDGSPGSSACTGSSTGSMAFRQNNAWKCF